MNKNLFKKFFYLIFILFFITTECSYAEMKTESLSIGMPNTGTGEETYSQTFQNKEISVPQTMQEEQVNNKEIITVPVPVYTPYYYPNFNNYTRRIGPYGVYSNWGIGGYDYKGFAFDYKTGSNKAIYVNQPAPPPPPPPRPNYNSQAGQRPPINNPKNRPKPNNSRP